MRKHASTLALLLTLSPLLGGAACVVQYGTEPVVRPAEPQAPPADFAQLQDRFEALYAGEAEVDRRDRLDAAMDLLRRGRTMPAEEQAVVLGYLKRLLAVEERAQPMDAPELFAETAPGEVARFTPVGTVIEEEDLGGVEQIEPVPDLGSGAGPDGDGGGEPAPTGTSEPPAAAPPTAVPLDGGADGAASGESGATDPVAQARAALAAGDPPGALAALAPCGAIDCGPDAKALSQQARDAWVHAERERAGALFVRARSEPDPVERSARLVEARDILVALVERFPDAQQIDDIQRNISLVQAELDAVR